MILQDVWITRDGRVMLITDMEDDHLANAINYLARRARELKEMRKRLTKEKRARRLSWLLKPFRWLVR